MLSVSNQKPAGLSLPLPLFLVAMATALLGGQVWGAWLPREPPKAAAPPTANQLPPPPSTQMLQALQYLQALSQQAPPLATTSNRQPIPSRVYGEAANEEGQAEGAWPGEEQQWVQAVLETLQETQRQVGGPDRPKTHPPALNPTPTRRRHRKYHQEEEEAEQGGGGWGNSLKRTNENADEQQYTPQKLATLQSVFEELRNVYGSKSESKRQSLSDYDEEEEEEEERGEEEREEEEEKEEQAEADSDRLRKMSVGEWEPLGEDEDEEEDDYNDLPIIKRSSQSERHVTEGAGQPDELSSLVDYYMLKLLEGTEQEEKREEEEEEEREKEEKREEEEEEEREEKERGAASLSLLQLVALSEKLGVSPEQLLGLLHSSSNPPPQQAPPRTPYHLPLGPQPPRTPAQLQAPPWTPYKLNIHTAPPPPALHSHTQAHTQALTQALTQAHTQAHTQALTQAHTQAHTADSLLSSPHSRPLGAPEDALSFSTAHILTLLGLPSPGPAPSSDITAPPPPPPRSRQRPKTARGPHDDAPYPHDAAQPPPLPLTELVYPVRRLRVADEPPPNALERLLLGGEEPEEEEKPEEWGLPAHSAGAEEEEPEERGLLAHSAGAEEEEQEALSRALQDFLVGQASWDRGVAMETRRRSGPDHQTEEQEEEEGDADEDLQRIVGFFKPELQHQDTSAETAKRS